MATVQVIIKVINTLLRSRPGDTKISPTPVNAISTYIQTVKPRSYHIFQKVTIFVALRALKCTYPASAFSLHCQHKIFAVHVLTPPSSKRDLSSNWAKRCGFGSGDPDSGPFATCTVPDREWVSNVLNGYLNVSDEWIVHDEAFTFSWSSRECQQFLGSDQPRSELSAPKRESYLMLPARQDEETGFASFILDTENDDLSTKLEAYAKRMMLPMTMFEAGPPAGRDF
ncbi:hypothetical protein EAE99_003008 [Botrytis elliptica]|nr:hypothetical protein EAE99_003008 [Botrytis elliptica]